MTSSPVVLMVLVLSIGFNLIAGAHAARTLMSEQRMDHLVTQFTEAQEIEELGGLMATGLEELFDEDKLNKRRRKRKRKNNIREKDIFQQEEELYSYSDLPRLF